MGGVGALVAVIVTRVVFRNVFNNALAWPDEAARFLMLWMVGLMAPSAFRWNGFVAIDTLPRALPRVAGLLLSLLLLLLAMSMMVLPTAVGHGCTHTFGFGGRFDRASLRVPLDRIWMKMIKVKLRHMYASLCVFILLLIVLNLELILRAVLALVSPDTGATL